MNTTPEASMITPQHNWVHTILGLLFGALCALSALLGLYAHALTLVVLGAVVFGGIGRLYKAYKGTLEWGLLRSPMARSLRWYRIQWLLSAAFVVSWWLAAKQNIDLLSFLAPSSLPIVWAVVFAVGGLFLLLATIPGRTISASANLAFLLVTVGTFGLLGQATFGGVAAKEVVTLHAPFKGQQVIFQGGNGPLINHHYILKSQRYALDLLKLNSKGLASTKGAKVLKDYASFGATLFAPASGTVIRAVDNLSDQAIGTTNPKRPVGNHVIIAIKGGKYVLLAHLKKGSLKVKKGAQVRAGQPLAACGNSGNTTMPHLHLQVQDRPAFAMKGPRTFPIQFVEAAVWRGSRQVHKPGFLRRGDRIISRGGQTQHTTSTKAR